MEKQCPVCQAEMIKNIEGKAKNAKAPDWKCSNPQCKFQWDKATQTYIPSQYRTACWDNRVGNTAPRPKDSPQRQLEGNNSDLKVIEGLLREILSELRKDKFPEPPLDEEEINKYF